MENQENRQGMPNECKIGSVTNHTETVKIGTPIPEGALVRGPFARAKRNAAISRAIATSRVGVQTIRPAMPKGLFPINLNRSANIPAAGGTAGSAEGAILRGPFAIAKRNAAISRAIATSRIGVQTIRTAMPKGPFAIIPNRSANTHAASGTAGSVEGATLRGPFAIAKRNAAISRAIPKGLPAPYAKRTFGTPLNTNMHYGYCQPMSKIIKRSSSNQANFHPSSQSALETTRAMLQSRNKVDESPQESSHLLDFYNKTDKSFVSAPAKIPAPTEVLYTQVLVQDDDDSVPGYDVINRIVSDQSGMLARYSKQKDDAEKKGREEKLLNDKKKAQIWLAKQYEMDRRLQEAVAVEQQLAKKRNQVRKPYTRPLQALIFQIVPKNKSSKKGFAREVFDEYWRKQGKVVEGETNPTFEAVYWVVRNATEDLRKTFNELKKEKFNLTEDMFKRVKDHLSVLVDDDDLSYRDKSEESRHESREPDLSVLVAEDDLSYRDQSEQSGHECNEPEDFRKKEEDDHEKVPKWWSRQQAMAKDLLNSQNQD